MMLKWMKLSRPQMKLSLKLLCSSIHMLILTVDASGTVVGVVLEQNSDGSDWKPVAFFSAENFGLLNRTTVRSIVNS